MAPPLIPDTPEELRPRVVMFQATAETRKGYRLVLQRADRLDPDGVPRYTLHGEFGPLHALSQRTSKTPFPVPWARVWTVYLSACMERFSHGYYLTRVDGSRGAGDAPPRGIASTAEELGVIVARGVRSRSPMAAATAADLIRRAPSAWRTAVRVEDLGILCRSRDDTVRLDAIQWLSTATAAPLSAPAACSSSGAPPILPRSHRR